MGLVNKNGSILTLFRLSSLCLLFFSLSPASSLKPTTLQRSSNSQDTARAYHLKLGKKWEPLLSLGYNPTSPTNEFNLPLQKTLPVWDGDKEKELRRHEMDLINNYSPIKRVSTTGMEGQGPFYSYQSPLPGRRESFGGGGGEKEIEPNQHHHDASHGHDDIGPFYSFDGSLDRLFALGGLTGLEFAQFLIILFPFIIPVIFVPLFIFSTGILLLPVLQINQRV